MVNEMTRGHPARQPEDQPLTQRVPVVPSARSLLCLLPLAAAIAACQPTVKVEAPPEPITINLNIKLDADVRVKLEEQAEQDIEANPDIF